MICGFGRVGAEIGAALDRWDQPYSVIELNPAIVRDLRHRGIDALYGDAASRAELESAGVPTARTVAVTTPDLLATEAVIRNARALNPAIHVIVRAPGTGEVSGLSARREPTKWSSQSSRRVSSSCGKCSAGKGSLRSRRTIW